MMTIKSGQQYCRDASIKSLIVIVGLILSLSSSTWGGEDLSGRDFSKADMRMRDLENGNLRGANLSFCDFTDTNLRGADFRDANLSCAKFSKADLTGADLRGAKLDRAGFRNANLSKANLEGQKLYLAGASIHFERPEGTPYGLSGTTPLDNGLLSFKGANLKNTEILGNLEGVDFRKANLAGANLRGASSLDKARFKGALYDRQTGWKTIDPDEIGAVLVAIEETPVDGQSGSKADSPSWVIGAWVIGAEAQAADWSVLVKEDGAYAWDIPKADLLRGAWRKASAEEVGDAKSKGVVLEKGADGMDWLVVPDGRDGLKLSALKGKQTRLAVRHSPSSR